MATFTLDLYEAFEYTGGTWSLEGPNTILHGGDIGLNHYQLFDESYRPILNGRIFDHYMNREIGMETIDLFKLAIRRRMNEIMPIYNKLYLAEKLEYDPLSTMDIRTVASGEAANESTTLGNSTTVNETESGSRSVASETPQTMLSGDADYASAASDATSKTSVTGDGEERGESQTSASNTSQSRVSGYQGSAAALLQDYRASLISVDAQLCEELRDCFMMVYDTSDPMSHPGTFERYF